MSILKYIGQLQNNHYYFFVPRIGIKAQSAIDKQHLQNSHKSQLSMVTATPVFQYKGARLPEGITYDHRNNSLLWVDIRRGEVHRVELPRTKAVEYTEADLNTIDNSHEVIKYKESDPSFLPSVGAIALTETPDIVIAAATQGIAQMNLKTSEFEYKYKFDFLPPGKEREFRSNDSSATPAGNLYIGVMSNFNAKEQHKGYLVKFDTRTKKFTILLDGVGISNGMAWSSDLKKFFHIDSSSYKVSVFDYDQDTDTISNKRVFFDSLAHFPKLYEMDGMTIDLEDNLYIAVWMGGQVFKLNQQGEIVQTFTFPAKRTDCPIFGGVNMDELFVTTADLNLDDEDTLASVEGDFGGAIFRTKVQGLRGMPKFYVSSEI